MGWNKGWEIIEELVISLRNKGALDLPILRSILEIGRDADIDEGGYEGRRANDGRTAKEIILQLHGSAMPHRPAIREIESLPDEQRERFWFYWDIAGHNAFLPIEKKYGWHGCDAERGMTMNESLGGFCFRTVLDALETGGKCQLPEWSERGMYIEIGRHEDEKRDDILMTLDPNDTECRIPWTITNHYVLRKDWRILSEKTDASGNREPNGVKAEDAGPCQLCGREDEKVIMPYPPNGVVTCEDCLPRCLEIERSKFRIHIALPGKKHPEDSVLFPYARSIACYMTAQDLAMFATGAFREEYERGGRDWMDVDAYIDGEKAGRILAGRFDGHDWLLSLIPPQSPLRAWGDWFKSRYLRPDDGS
uniref:Uncharacterized protein n=2 Tax=Candidatus Kentrum sp. TC TaxID=2126339 RepID=A0A450YWH0_9GAMM|nr:MAG: hypothetical protein BECKTC1821E_GA0114239_105426 [Candidatus Kentron sp. TC]